MVQPVSASACDTGDMKSSFYTSIFHSNILYPEQHNSLHLPVIGCNSDGGAVESLEIKWLVSTAFYVLLCIIIFIINVTVVTIVTLGAGIGDLATFHQ